MNSYEQFKDSEFYAFFHVTETNTTNHGSTQIHTLKTGGFTEHTSILAVTREDLLISIQLNLDTAFVGNEKQINPFAKDIAKSFIATFIPQAEDIANGIWNLQGTNDTIIAWGTEDDYTPSKDILPFLDVYTGKTAEHSHDFADATLHVKRDNSTLAIIITNTYINHT